GVVVTGPPGPTRQNAPLVAVHAPSAPATTGSENVTTTRAPVGTSSWPSSGYVNTTPGSAVASGPGCVPQAAANAPRRTQREVTTIREDIANAPPLRGFFPMGRRDRSSLWSYSTGSAG